jgi:acyl-CoA reductase-like NAD-dependent aldehyde dehydrogenase
MTFTTTTTITQELYIDGAWVAADRVDAITNRWTDEPLGSVAIADATHAANAVSAGAAALKAGLPVHDRVAILDRAAVLLTERAETAAQLITAEMGKPLSAARIEVQRAISVLQLSSQEALRLPTESMNLEGTAAGEGIVAFTLPVPVGVVAAITPFNFPINLVAHKVGPALAAGCPVVLKPSDKGRLIAGLFTEVLIEAGLPAGFLNLITGPAEEIVPVWLAHEDVAVINFTGSSSVGWGLKAASPKKHHVLELGSNTALVVDHDADIATAAAFAAQSAMVNSGQACISLQRIFVHESIIEEFSASLRGQVAALAFGDPSEESTVVGPLVADHNVDRLNAWVEEAVSQGADILVGGRGEGKLFPPTVLQMQERPVQLLRDEAFGPIVVIVPVPDAMTAIERVNGVDYGLNAAIFTHTLPTALEFARRAQSGTALVNIPPHFRADQMPYGGVKDSGQGREGVRYAVAEMLQQKLVLIRA